ncbi:MAG: hypothetical protein NVSMB65_05430 [Chloroflexota bacterium]
MNMVRVGMVQMVVEGGAPRAVGHTRYGELWRASYQTLSRRYAIPVIGVSGVGWMTAGPWAGRKPIGCSVAIGAGGSVLAQGPYGEAASCVLCVDVPLQQPLARGTAMAEALRRRGYDGP